MSDARKRQNRALHNLAREPRTTRQLWQVGAGNATIAELERAGLIWTLGTLTPNAETWDLTPAGVAEFTNARVIEATY